MTTEIIMYHLTIVNQTGALLLLDIGNFSLDVLLDFVLVTLLLGLDLENLFELLVLVVSGELNVFKAIASCILRKRSSRV